MIEKSDSTEDVGLEERGAAPVPDGRDVPGTDADPTLDIVRQLITEAEALPPPEVKPATAAPAEPPVSAPVQPSATGRRLDSPTAPWHDPKYADLDDDLDADAEIDPEDEADNDWEALYGEGGVRSYGIVDPETGLVDGRDPDGEEIAETPAAPRRRSPGLVRWTGRLITSLLGFAWRLMRALLVWAGRRLAAAGRVAGRFLARPDAPRRLSVALIVFCVIVWPWDVLWLTLLVPLALVITWASVGSEGCAELTVNWYERLKARDPDKAERIRLRAAATSRAVARVLDRLPERWTQGLYLPDFEPEGFVPEKLKVDPFEELAARIHSEKQAGGT